MHEFDEKKLKTDFGINAKVERREVSNKEALAKANGDLKKIGDLLNPINPEVLEYFGSCAVHIYKSPVLNQVYFVSQISGLKDVPEVIASEAIGELKGSAMAHYGRRKPKRRSGL